MKKVFVFVITIILALAIYQIVFAKADSCVVHKGKKLWVNSHALKGHLKHGDKLCSNNSDGGGTDPTTGEELIGQNKIVKMVSAEYLGNGTLKMVWRGMATSFRICDKQMNCTFYEPPSEFTATTSGYRGYLQVSLEKGKYFVYANGSKSGDDGSISFIIK